MGDDDVPLRDFADRAIRDSLANAANLRGFLLEAIPEIAAHLDFERVRILPREHLMDDWRGREADILCEIPFRRGDRDQTILICILLEHQSTPDPRMPLRTFLYAAFYWERQWKEWEKTTPPRSPLQLTPIVPIVLHTGARPWTTSKRLIDLIDAPEALLKLMPAWEPIFWELAKHDSRTLLNSEEAFLQVLAVIRLEGAEKAEFESAFRNALQQLDELHGKDKVRWYDLLRLLITWASWRRPPNERKEWWEMAETMQTDASRQRDIREIRRSIGDEIFDEGRVEGLAKGLAKGRVEGRVEGLVEALRSSVMRLGKKRFGLAPAETVVSLNAIKDVESLEQLNDRLLDVNSWDELMAP